jgi:hypothetical protein
VKVECCPDCGAILEARNNSQNAKLHALLADIARRHVWAGQRLALEDWKRLFIAAFVRASGAPARFMPALDGQGFDVIGSTPEQFRAHIVAEVAKWKRLVAEVGIKAE